VSIHVVQTPPVFDPVVSAYMWTPQNIWKGAEGKGGLAEGALVYLPFGHAPFDLQKNLA